MDEEHLLSNTQKLKNGPLIYVLAQIQISPVLKIGKFVDDIQERLRGDYPRLQKKTIQSVNLALLGSEKSAEVDLEKVIETHNRWLFTNEQETTGFILDNSSFALHTTDYPTFEPFLEWFRAGITILGEVVDVGLVQRLGLRYMDLIDPIGNDSIDQYVSEGLHGFPLHHIAETNDYSSQTISRGETSAGYLVARYTRSKEEISLPSDITPLVLPHDHKKRNPDKLAALLDFDHYRTETIKFSPDEIMKRMRELHDATSTIFHGTATEHAFKKWQ